MEIRVSLEMGDEDGPTLLRSQRKETVVGPRLLDTTAPDPEGIGMMLELAIPAMSRVVADAHATINEAAADLIRALRS